MTIATIGRLMKNFDMPLDSFPVVASRGQSLLDIALEWLGLHCRTRREIQLALDDYAFARL